VAFLEREQPQQFLTYSDHPCTFAAKPDSQAGGGAWKTIYAGDWEHNAVETFERLNASPAHQRWYFGVLRDIFSARLGESSLVALAG